jgi:hypothetical protein
MRWYTRAWQRGDESDNRPDASDTYNAYLTSIAYRLSPDVLAFAQSAARHLAVDDAKLDRFEVDPKSRRISLRLLNGDLQTGYGKLTLAFLAADLVEPTFDRVKAILADPRTEFVVHEVELTNDGRLEVRFLLWPEGEIVIRCSALTHHFRPIQDQARTDYRREVVCLG